MIQLINLFIVFLCLKGAYSSSLTEVQQDCIKKYSSSASNDDLIGTWYSVYKFALFLNLLPSSTCPNTTIVKANRSEIQRYSEAYGPDNPYSFNDNAVLVNEDNSFYGMLMGNTQTRFYVFDPTSVFHKKDRVDAKVYLKINDDYMLYHNCALRGHERWLLSRRRDQTTEEIEQVLKSISSEVGRMETQRYCYCVSYCFD